MGGALLSGPDPVKQTNPLAVGTEVRPVLWELGMGFLATG